MASADSGIQTVTASVLDGVWLHEDADPENTLTQYLFGNKSSRTENLSVEGAEIVVLGREYPLADFGIGEERSVGIQFTIPWDDGHDETVENLRALVRHRNVLCYRDNRARLVFGVLEGLTINDTMYGSEVAGTIVQVERFGVTA